MREKENYREKNYGHKLPQQHTHTSTESERACGSRCKIEVHFFTILDRNLKLAVGRSGSEQKECLLN